MIQTDQFRAPWHGFAIAMTFSTIVIAVMSFHFGPAESPAKSMPSVVITSAVLHTAVSQAPPKPAVVARPNPVVTPPPTPPPAAPKSTPKAPVAKAPTPTPPAAPTSDIAPESACPGQSNIAQASIVLACMTRYARLFHGVNAVSTHSILESAAIAKAGDIVSCNDFSHTACGHVSNYWLTQKNYPSGCSAENIAQGQQTPGAVFVAWMNSSGHRANILRPGYTDIGIGEQSSPSGPTWVMELGGC